jgi:hypothetical protein
MLEHLLAFFQAACQTAQRLSEAFGGTGHL